VNQEAATTAPPAAIVNTQVVPEPMENAAPGL